MKRGIIFICFLFTVQLLVAQTKTTENFNRVWVGYFNQTRLSNKWGFWAEGQLRTKEDFVKDLSQSILRVGLTYYITDVSKFTVGYAFVNDFPGDNHKNISAPEHRPWQQIQWHTKYGKNRMMQWIRLEERYRHKVKNDDELADGYNFNFRIRYNLWYEIPFIKNGTDPNSWSFLANDEVFINFGKNIVNNYFDQNRFFLGFKYQAGKHTNLQFGYMNLFQQLPAGNQYRNMNVARVSFFHNVDLRAK
ncbi:MAG: DUF2490 domain-containing protein [Ferruginibacter sp.]